MSPRLRQGGRRDLPASHHGSVKARKGVLAYQDIVPRAQARVPPQRPDTLCGVADGADGPFKGPHVALPARPNSGPTPTHMCIPFEEVFLYVPHARAVRGPCHNMCDMPIPGVPSQRCRLARSANDPKVAGPWTTLPHKRAPAAWIPVCALFSGALAPLTQRSQRCTHVGSPALTLAHTALPLDA